MVTCMSSMVTGLRVCSSRRLRLLMSQFRSIRNGQGQIKRGMKVQRGQIPRMLNSTLRTMTITTTLTVGTVSQQVTLSQLKS